MKEEKLEGSLERQDIVELDDGQLEKVAGGQRKAKQDGKYYEWNGGVIIRDSSWDHAYLCPRCGRKTHYDWSRYWCDACDESWYYEDKLRLNLEDGYWKEITKEEYESGDPKNPGAWHPY